MDPVSTALTTAWLDAVRRVQAEALRHQRHPSLEIETQRDELALTDVIENTLRAGGAADQATDGWRRPAPTAESIDILV
jgi:hypothetical protein